jgi:tetratricopeptide (TPR) repeat protein
MAAYAFNSHPMGPIVFDLISFWLILAGLATVIWFTATVWGKTYVLDFRGQMFVQNGKFDQADALFQQALALRLRTYGECHTAVAQSYLLLAGAACDRGKIQEQLVYLEKAQMILENLLPSNHPELLKVLNEVAISDIHRGLFRKAADILGLLLQRVPPSLANRKLERVSYMNNLATCLLELGEYTQADEWLRKARSIITALNADSKMPLLKPVIASTQSRLRLKQNRLAEAQSLVEEADELLKNFIPLQPIPENIFGLIKGELALAFHDIELARQIAIQIIRQQEKRLGIEHIYIIAPVLLLAKCHAHMKQMDKAEDGFIRAYTLVEKQIPLHPLRAEILSAWGAMLVWQGKFSEAEPLLVMATEHRRKILPNFHPDLAESLEHLAQLHRLQQRESEANRLEADAAYLRRVHAEQEKQISRSTT